MMRLSRDQLAQPYALCMFPSSARARLSGHRGKTTAISRSSRLGELVRP